MPFAGGNNFWDDNIPWPHNTPESDSKAGSNHHGPTARNPSTNTSCWVHLECEEDACTYGSGKTQWEWISQLLDSDSPYYPWYSKEEFELVRWILDANLSQADIDHFLKLSFVR
jgi:hypothetical protein